VPTTTGLATSAETTIGGRVVRLSERRACPSSLAKRPSSSGAPRAARRRQARQPTIPRASNQTIPASQTRANAARAASMPAVPGRIAGVTGRDSVKSAFVEARGCPARVSATAAGSISAAAGRAKLGAVAGGAASCVSATAGVDCLPATVCPVETEPAFARAPSAVAISPAGRIGSETIPPGAKWPTRGTTGEARTPTSAASQSRSWRTGRDLGTNRETSQARPITAVSVARSWTSGRSSGEPKSRFMSGSSGLCRSIGGCVWLLLQ
jgi:hypothetical protein